MSKPYATGGTVPPETQMVYIETGYVVPPSIAAALKYSEDEARDEAGKWTAGGGEDLSKMSVADLSARITDRMGTTVSVGNIDRKKFASATGMLLRLHDEFPAVTVRSLKMGPVSRAEGLAVQAVTTTGPWQKGSDITLASPFWRSGGKPIGPDSTAGWRVPGTDNPAGVMAHEFGHAVDDAAAKVSYGMTLRPGTPEAWRMNELGRLPAISRYGEAPSGENVLAHGEKFAELFSATYSGLSSAPPEQEAALRAYLGATLGLSKIVKYSETQERVPAGSPGGGEFAGGGDGGPWATFEAAQRGYAAAHPGFAGTNIEGLGDIQGRAGRDMLNRLDELQNQFPQVWIDRVSMVSMPDNPMAVAATSYIPGLHSSQIVLNQDDWSKGNPGLLYLPQTTDFNVPGSQNPAGYITHEFGHAVADLLTYGGPMAPEYSKWYLTQFLNSKPISGYGHYSPEEKYAELFTAAMSPKGPSYDDPRCVSMREALRAANVWVPSGSIAGVSKAATITKVSPLKFADTARAILRHGYAVAYASGKQVASATILTPSGPPPLPPAFAALPVTSMTEASDDDDTTDEEQALYEDDEDDFGEDWWDEPDLVAAVDTRSDQTDEALIGFGALLMGGAASGSQLDAWLGGWSAGLNPLYEQGFQAGVADNGEIEQATWVAEDDPETCEDCQALDGMTWVGDEIDAAMPHPGDSQFGGRTQCGPNCRCSIDYEIVPSDQAVYSWGGYGDSVQALSTAELVKLWVDIVKYSEDELRDEQGRWTSGSSEPSAALAEKLVAKARGHEAATTADLQEIATKVGGNLNSSFRLGDKEHHALDARIKTVGSSTRKIAEEAAKGTSLQEIEDQKMRDNLRYTMTVPPDRLGAVAQATSDALVARGYTPFQATDYFGAKEGYAGLHTNWWTPDGEQKVELQFHTPDTFVAKEEESHPLYEAQRRFEVNDKQHQVLQTQIDKVWATVRETPVPVPTDYLSQTFPVFKQP